MAFITLRQANVVTAPNATIKGSPLTNSEVDNNFANINIQVVDSSNTIVALDTAVQGLGSTINNLSSSAISNGTSSLTVLEDGDLVVTGNIVPTTNVAFNLGNANFRFKDIFLSGNTIDLGGVPISVDSSGNLLFNANIVATPQGLNTDSIPDGSIVEAKIGSSAVTTAKIADANVTTAKLAVSGVTAGDYGNATLIPAFTVGVDGRITSASNVEIVGGATLEDNTAADASFYPTMSKTDTGNFTTAVVTTTKLYFNPSTGVLNATDFNSLSDATLKTNLQPIENAISILDNITGFEFNWKDSNRKSAGVIAQDVEAILPHLVSSNKDGTKSVNYGSLSAYLIQCVKELTNRVKELENKNGL